MLEIIAPTECQTFRKTREILAEVLKTFLPIELDSSATIEAQATVLVTEILPTIKLDSSVNEDAQKAVLETSSKLPLAKS